MAKQRAHFILEGSILQVSLGLIEQDLVPGTYIHEQKYILFSQVLEIGWKCSL